LDGRAIMNQSVTDSEDGRDEGGIRKECDGAQGREKESGLGTEGRTTWYAGSGVGFPTQMT
jgi:hypothetical protein